MTDLHDSIKSDVLNEFDQMGDDIIDYYRDSLDELINDAIAKVEGYLNRKFPICYQIIEYFDNCGNEKSLELIKDNDTDAMLANGSYHTTLDFLYGMLEDNLGYLIACGMLGHGRGLWELFDSFPCLNTLV